MRSTGEFFYVLIYLQFFFTIFVRTAKLCYTHTQSNGIYLLQHCSVHIRDAKEERCLCKSCTVYISWWYTVLYHFSLVSGDMHPRIFVKPSLLYSKLTTSTFQQNSLSDSCHFLLLSFSDASQKRGMSWQSWRWPRAGSQIRRAENEQVTTQMPESSLGYTYTHTVYDMWAALNNVIMNGIMQCSFWHLLYI